VDRPWYAHYDPDVPRSIDYPDITLPQLFERTAGRYPDRVVTIFSGKKLRYRDVKRQIDSFAAGLRALGVQPGERVAIMLPNVPQFLVAFYGALQSGAVVVPTNPLYTQHELEHQLGDAGVSVVVTLDQLFPKVQMALPYTQTRTVICTSIADALPVQRQPVYAIKRRRQGVHLVKRAGIVHRFDSLLAHRPEGVAPSIKPDALAVLQYTGGTTGRSKGAMLSHRNLVANAVQAYQWQADSQQDDAGSILCVAPFFHVYGMTVGMNLGVVAGASLILAPRFDAKEVAALAEKYRPAYLPGVPTMFVALSQVPGVSPRQFRSLRACMSGAAPLPAEVQARFEALSGARVVEGYGLTEAGPVTHCNPLGDVRSGTVGVPWPDTDACVTNPETWKPLPPGAIGELTVAGPQVMMGYWNREQETRDVLRDGWLHTGDIASMDGDGYFRIVDRKKDLIIAGGYNVYPREVEDVLYSHPGVLEAAVVGAPSEYRGETVKAFVVLREGTEVSAQELILFCRHQLAAYKVPRLVEFRSELPKSLIGKILRRQLRDEPDANRPATPESNHLARPVA